MKECPTIKTDAIVQEETPPGGEMSDKNIIPTGWIARGMTIIKTEDTIGDKKKVQGEHILEG